MERARSEHVAAAPLALGAFATPPTLARARRSTFAILTQPLLCRAVLAGADLAAYALSMAVAVAIYRWHDPKLPLELYTSVWPLLLAFLPVYALMRLYGISAMPPAEELRRVIGGTALVYLLIAVGTFLAKQGPLYSRGVFLIACGTTMTLVPLLRAGVRFACCRRRWWGVPIIVLGAGLTGKRVVDSLLAHPEQGMRPIAVFDDDDSKRGDYRGVPVLAGLDHAPALARELRIDNAILAMPGAPVGRLLALERASQDAFPHLIIIPNICGFASLWVSARDLGGVLGLEVQRNLLMRGPRILKRLLDLALCALGALPVLVLTAVVAVLIKLESRGPVFFGHERIGCAGRRFPAWKFRSMVADADRVLAAHLAAHPELREQWERDHKLRDDPRVTRVGRLLRRTSFDELPQLWNVVLGDMSLIGPRPIVDAEVPRYQDMFQLYLRVRPGISGLWQVSGRNDTTYGERVALDSYYVRNWSVWLDIYILARTVRAVCFGKGAY